MAALVGQCLFKGFKAAPWSTIAHRMKNPLRRVSSTASHRWSTPLANTLADAISATGPISIAQYMRQCLTSDHGGYYTTKASEGDQFGTKGDFVTSPEISQVFGELVGVWMVSEWIAQGRQPGVQIIEVGPGRGTLMDDLLRTLTRFKTLSQSIDNIFLVEASSSLREQQKTLLCGTNPMEQVGNGLRSKSQRLNSSITWFEDMSMVPSDPFKTPFIFAHEFFDALPIHTFQSIPLQSKSHGETLMTPTGPLSLKSTDRKVARNQWRELMVTPTQSIATSSVPTSQKETNVNFHLTLAKSSTPSSLLLPSLSARYQALLDRPNSIIEISPQSHSIVADFARRIGGSLSSQTSNPSSSTTPPMVKPKPSGAALIVDYGPLSTIPTNSLRGIQSHKLVSPLSSPGKVDISADVDFTALAEAAINASEGVEVHGPVEQGAWLGSMGIRERAEALCKAVEKESSKDVQTKEISVKEIRRSVERLVERGGGGMGRLYKFLAIVPENRGKRRPVGFGGNIT